MKREKGGTGKSRKIKVDDSGRKAYTQHKEGGGLSSDNIKVAKEMFGARKSLTERHGMKFGKGKKRK